jgi:hypothetical protein
MGADTLDAEWYFPSPHAAALADEVIALSDWAEHATVVRAALAGIYARLGSVSAMDSTLVLSLGSIADSSAAY